MILKRAADWLEKFSVAALAVGIFQEKMLAAVLGILALFGCFWLTKNGR